jgi:hypothetical protein
MSSYAGELTLHSNLYGDATDKEHVLGLLGPDYPKCLVESER